MRISVKYFSPIDSIINKDIDHIEFAANPTLQQVIEKLKHIYGKKFAILVHAQRGEELYNVMFILNNRHVTSFDLLLQDGDQLIILPRIGGG